MEVHRQQCQACGSRRLNNILAREARLRTVVYVRCADCSALVARYELADYYHHGRGVESFLRSHDPGLAESGRQMMTLFKQAEKRAVEGFRAVMAILEKTGRAP
ncbi:MAG: hypothetical protein AAF772_15905 [Acidobacteriota bacterium]